MTIHFEHFALNVTDPVELATWYVDYVGCAVLTQAGPPKHTTFLADASGRTFLEVYHNAAAPINDFRAREPLTFHFAFQTDDAAGLRDRLLAAGATPVEEQEPESGTHLVMLRDPWGIPLQLCQRRDPYPTAGR
ncbi:glyoxalase/bleomycin resistance protein/dioxygenase superfamily protein [Neolewinella xylanilytica]|uniref:Glyoxalase/bleomycin resistance protein/dioxygenase superfamily protein n=1 Tax=Neolewinella xylanilytica TaxID=1514080 RepID=A0A2S6I4Y1_9BACT|nr:VOC family protein [Neolewinella xylanilytica]PPK86202.1 glyoxalase/bleomycin resistance protein/dioxygenase superfamily protein [Neolewinella xylanilytica]